MHENKISFLHLQLPKTISPEIMASKKENQPRLVPKKGRNNAMWVTLVEYERLDFVSCN